jgi:hypothetical protein
VDTSEGGGLSLAAGGVGSAANAGSEIGSIGVSIDSTSPGTSCDGSLTWDVVVVGWSGALSEVMVLLAVSPSGPPDEDEPLGAPTLP